MFQLTEELGFPSSSEEAFFSQSFNEEGDFEYDIVFSGSHGQIFAEMITPYSRLVLIKYLLMSVHQ